MLASARPSLPSRTMISIRGCGPRSRAPPRPFSHPGPAMRQRQRMNAVAAEDATPRPLRVPPVQLGVHHTCSNTHECRSGIDSDGHAERLGNLLACRAVFDSRVSVDDDGTTHRFNAFEKGPGNVKLDEEFFGSGKECARRDQQFSPVGHVTSNFPCNSGYGDSSKLFLRSPRLEFNETCTLM